VHIKPLPGTYISPAFEDFVSNAFQSVTIKKCSQVDCAHCNAASPEIRELVHFSRDQIETWLANGPGNQLCWSQVLADRESNIDSITDQPCRRYQLLCLAKITNCPNLIVREERGRHTIHFGFTFALQRQNLVRIALEFNEGEKVYICKKIL